MFKRVRPFKERELNCFINLVENAVELCGNEPELEKMGMQIIQSEKLREVNPIITMAKHSTWQTIKASLISIYKSRETLVGEYIKFLIGSNS